MSLSAWFVSSSSLTTTAWLKVEFSAFGAGAKKFTVWSNEAVMTSAECVVRRN